MTTRWYMGLDVHSKSSAFAVADQEGKTVVRGEVATTWDGLRRLREEYGISEGTPVALEAGTMAFWVSRALASLGLEPVVIDSYEVRRKAHRPTQKSDRRDARELCEGLRCGMYRTMVHVPDPRMGSLRETLSRRRHFVRLGTSEVNAVKHLLRSRGLGPLARSLTTDTSWERLISRLSPDEELRSEVARHRALWRCAREQVGGLERRLAEAQNAYAEDVRRLQTVPGVGPIVALTTLAFLSDVSRFPSAKRAASYAGLVPSTHQSGDHDAHGRITKRGSGELRAMLCEAAHHARRPDHPLNPYFSVLCARKGYRIAVVAVAHRLCRILYAMLRDRKDFDVERLRIEMGPFEKKIVRLYRLRPEPRA
jgi:transposase